MIMVTCCEHYAIVSLTFKDMAVESTFDLKILPPPPLQTSVLIPSNWRIQDVTSNDSGYVYILKYNCTLYSLFTRNQ